MLFCGYKYGFRLNALHDISGNEENKHAHTFYISLYIEAKNTDDFHPYYLVENKIEKYLEKFNGKFLNEEPEFKDITPVYENIGLVFYKELAKVINDGHYILQKLEINENPLATNIIK